MNNNLWEQNIFRNVEPPWSRRQSVAQSVDAGVKCCLIVFENTCRHSFLAVLANLGNSVGAFRSDGPYFFSGVQTADREALRCGIDHARHLRPRPHGVIAVRSGELEPRRMVPTSCLQAVLIALFARACHRLFLCLHASNPTRLRAGGTRSAGSLFRHLLLTLTNSNQVTLDSPRAKQTRMSLAWSLEN